MRKSIWSLLAVTLVISLLSLTACSGNSLPTSSVTAVATVDPGPLNRVTLDQYGLTLLAPSAWKPPVRLDNNSFIISPDGSTDTSIGAGPFLYVVTDALKTFRTKISFKNNLPEPTDQLDALMQAINRDGPQYEATKKYNTPLYSGAIVRGYERANEITIILLKSDKGWLYIGSQAKESDFKYYEDNVFKPLIDSITLK